MSKFKILGIDKDKCIKCEDCVKSCSVQLFSVKREDMEKWIVFDDPFRFCFRCGHCISVCPTNAIQFTSPELPFEFEETNQPSTLLSYENYMKFIRSRRSTRKYTTQPLEKKKIEQIIEAMRYSPSASNRQNREYLVITNKEKIKEFSKEVGKLMKKAKRYLKLKYILAPFITSMLRKRLLNPKTKRNLEIFFERTKKGDDLIFFNAPCVIVVHSRPYSNMSASDAAISIVHGMLAAHSLNLGTCWIGFAHEYLTRFKKARKKLGIPSSHNVFGVFIIGYPELTFRRAPPRRKEIVHWIE